MIIKVENLYKEFNNNNVLNNINLQIKKGDFVTIYGKSGCGKSTLLNIIGLLDYKYKWNIVINGVNNPKINKKSGRDILRNNMSYIFQSFALIEEETVMENLDVALEYKKMNRSEKQKRKEEALKEVNLLEHKKKKVYQLSGGQQQRVAIARIILKDSDILLADEPTGSLDEKTRDEIIELLCKLNKKGKTIVIVTHDEIFKKFSDKIIEL
ncbi:MAG: putative bacteriocin export ABC transporter [Mycoplasmatales bacterium]